MTSRAPTPMILSLLEAMGHPAKSPWTNYIIPGLASQLLVERSPRGGRVRLLEMTRDQDVEIVPHSHRYTLDCLVVEGCVTNTNFLYNSTPRAADEPTHLLRKFHKGDMKPRGSQSDKLVVSFKEPTTYEPGDWYRLEADTIHSIKFDRGAKVILVEGPELASYSHVLLPYAFGKVCDTFNVQPWMRPEALEI